MPELPEVESAREYLQEKVLRQPIKAIIIRDKRILSSSASTFASSSASSSRVSPEDLRTVLEGMEQKSFKSVQRHGKRLFLELEGDLWLTIHLGMTGRLIYLERGETEPGHARLLILFENGCCMAFDDPRIFGEVGITENPAAFLAEHRIGPDALEIDLEEFREIMRGRKGVIKALLLNQRHIAGIGNLYADESLFQAAIHPRSRSLDEMQLTRLFSSIQEVLRRSVSLRADLKQLPESYLLRHRYPGGICPRDGTTLKHETIQGRTSYYCPKHQKLTE